MQKRKSFDPDAESIVLPNQKKKKAAVKRERWSNVTVILLKEYMPTVPRGDFRKELVAKGIIQNVKFTQSMSSVEAENQILHASSSKLTSL